MDARARRDHFVHGLSDDLVVGVVLVGRDGRIRQANAAACELLGRSRPDLVGLTWPQITHPEDRSASESAVARLCSGRAHTVTFDKRYVRPDGEVVWMRVTSSLALVDGDQVFVTQLQDATAEHEALRCVAASERRFRAFAEATSDGVAWVRLGPDAAVLYVNDAFAVLAGRPLGSLSSTPDILTALTHPDDLHLIGDLAEAVDADGVVLRWLRDDGSTVWVELRQAWVGDDTGLGQEALLVARDVSHRLAGAEAQARVEREQRAVTELLRFCDGGATVREAGQVAVDLVAQTCGADGVALWTECGSSDLFELVAAAGFHAGDIGCFEPAAVTHPARVRSVDGPTDWTPRIDVDDLAARRGFTWGRGVPVRAGHRIVGVVALYFLEPPASSAEWGIFLDGMAGVLGSAFEYRRGEVAAQRNARYDTLTGLPNRRYFLDALESSVAARRPDEVVAVAVCDIDDLRLINEAHGLAAGDEVIVEIADRLRRLVGIGLLARLEGDSFVVSRVGASEEVLGDRLRRDIATAFDAPVALASGDFPISASVGMGLCSTDDDPDPLLSALDALAEAKSIGRGRNLVSGGRSPAVAARRLSLVHALRPAIAEGRIEAHFQPVVELASQRLVGFEALARWKLADGTQVAPDEFIPLAEESGLIGDLGLSMLDQAASFLESLRPADGVCIGVNVSPTQLEDPGLADRISEVLVRHRIPRSGICLEITEGSLVVGDRAMKSSLQSLKRLGVSLAIDDFGTGYSNFAYITDFPFDVIKLDRSLIDAVERNERQTTVVRGVIQLAAALHLHVLAEGVETDTQRARLVELGCDLAQGYLWSPAEPAALASARYASAMVGA
jgi:PAS domain S-box-containing protein/diguanylate cyclase (GGDEF)-like protein